MRCLTNIAPIHYRESSNRHAICLLPILFLVMTRGLAAADSPPPSDMACIRDLGIPTFTSVARRAHTGGTITAVVTIGPSGKSSAVSVSGTQADLGEEVKIFLEDDTTYQLTCSGKKVTLTFEFRLEGQPVSNPWTKVRFLPPNRFVIISNPMLPAIDR